MRLFINSRALAAAPSIEFPPNSVVPALSESFPFAALSYIRFQASLTDISFPS